MEATEISVKLSLAMNDFVDRLVYKNNYAFIGYLRGAVYSTNPELAKDLLVYKRLKQTQREINHNHNLKHSTEDLEHYLLKEQNHISRISVYRNVFNNEYAISIPYIPSKILNYFTFNGHKINGIKTLLKIGPNLSSINTEIAGLLHIINLHTNEIDELNETELFSQVIVFDEDYNVNDIRIDPKTN